MKIHTVLIVVGLILLSAASISAEECLSYADVNGDGVEISVADLVFLKRFVIGDTVELITPYEADIDGDCVITYNDYLLFNLIPPGIKTCIICILTLR